MPIQENRALGVRRRVHTGGHRGGAVEEVWSSRVVNQVAQQFHGRSAMCRNIKPLFNFDPPATEEEIVSASLQFVRKLSGFTRPSKANEAVFEEAVLEVSGAARRLIDALVTDAEPKSRAAYEEKRRAQNARRFAPRS